MKTVIKADVEGRKEINKENLRHTKDSFKNAKENTKINRNALRILQQSAATNQNLAGRILEDKDKVANSKSNEETPVEVVDKAVQTGESVITAEDLTSDEPSGDYWKVLAEKREKTLNENLKEKERLKKIIEELQAENQTCKKMLEESKLLVEVLQEMMVDAAEDALEASRER